MGSIEDDTNFVAGGMCPRWLAVLLAFLWGVAGCFFLGLKGAQGEIDLARSLYHLASQDSGRCLIDLHDCKRRLVDCGDTQFIRSHSLLSGKPVRLEDL